MMPEMDRTVHYASAEAQPWRVEMSLYQKFLGGSVPKELDLSGEWIVRGLLGNLPLRVLLQKKVFRPAGQGRFKGNNQFLGSFNVAPFTVSTGPSALEPDLEVVRICYDQPGNPGIVRRLTDEVRMVGAEEYLGRGIYDFPGLGPRNTFWFTVSRR